MNEIILDYELGRSLIKPDKKSNDIFQTVKNNNYFQEVLFYFLLYDKIWLPHDLIKEIETKNTQRLFKEGIIDFIPDAIFKNQFDKTLDIIEKKVNISAEMDLVERIGLNTSLQITHEETYQHLLKYHGEYEIIKDNFEYQQSVEDNIIGIFEEIILNYLTKNHKLKSMLPLVSVTNFSIESFYMIKSIIYGNNNILNCIGEIQKELWKNAEGLIDEEYSHVESTMYDTEELEFFLNDQGVEIPKKKSRRELLRQFLKHLKNNWESSIIWTIENLLYLHYYMRLKEVLTFSNIKKIPIRAAVKLMPKSNIKPGKIQDDLYRIYRIILNEVEFIPIIHDLEDFLRLRENKQFKKFREILNEWIKLVKIGDVKYEDKIRKDIRTANKEIKKIKKHKKIAGLVTLFTLPLTVVDLFVGIPTGSLITAISGIYQLKSYIKKNKYSWVLFGDR